MMLYPDLITHIINKDKSKIYSYLETNHIPITNLASKCLYHICVLGVEELVEFLLAILKEEKIKEIDLVEPVFLFSSQYNTEIQELLYKTYPNIMLAKQLHNCVVAKEEDVIDSFIKNKENMKLISANLYIHCIKTALYNCSDNTIVKMIDAYSVLDKSTCSFFKLSDIYEEAIINEKYIICEYIASIEKPKIENYNQLLKLILRKYQASINVITSNTSYVNKLTTQINFLLQSFNNHFTSIKDYQYLLLGFFELGNHKENNLLNFYCAKAETVILKEFLNNLQHIEENSYHLSKMIARSFYSKNAMRYNSNISLENLSYLFIEKEITINKKISESLKENEYFVHLQEKIKTYKSLNKNLKDKNSLNNKGKAIKMVNKV